MFGKRDFETTDESRNLAWLAIPTFGEAWHNSHHAFPTSAVHGMKGRQIDPSAGVIWSLEKVGPGLGRRPDRPGAPGRQGSRRRLKPLGCAPCLGVPRPRPGSLAAAIAAALFARRLWRRTSKVTSVKGVDANCGDIQYSGSGQPSKLIVSDLPLQGDSAERSKQMNDAIVQEMARKGWQAGEHRGRLPGLRRLAGLDRRVGREPLPVQRPEAYAGNPDVIGVIGTYNSGCAADRDPDPEQGARRRPADGLAGQHLRLPDRAGPPSASRTSRTSTTRRARATTSAWSRTTRCRWPASPASPTSRGSTSPFILVAADDPTSKGQARHLRGRRSASSA